MLTRLVATGLIHGLLGVIVVMICSAQSCSTVAVLGTAPVASPLTPGIYSGTRDCQYTYTFGSQVLNEFAESNSSIVIIGTNGLPVDDGSELYPGQQIVSSVGGFTIDLIVENVTPTADGVLVTYDALLAYDDGSGLLLVVAGIWEEAYEIESGNSISMISRLVGTTETNDGPILAVSECSGLVTQ